MNMKLVSVLSTFTLALFASSIFASGSNFGGGNIGHVQWFTSDLVSTTTSASFLPMPETFVVFKTKGKPRDFIVHFCAQIDEAFGKALVRISVDGSLFAEPNEAPGPTLSWDSSLPTTKCMQWVLPAVRSGEHVVQVEWSHEGGTESRVSYRTLVVYY
jgi:hypothetical protein